MEQFLQIEKEVTTKSKLIELVILDPQTQTTLEMYKLMILLFKMLQSLLVFLFVNFQQKESFYR